MKKATINIADESSFLDMVSETAKYIHDSIMSGNAHAVDDGSYIFKLSDMPYRFPTSDKNAINEILYSIQDNLNDRIATGLDYHDVCHYDDDTSDVNDFNSYRSINANIKYLKSRNCIIVS